MKNIEPINQIKLFGLDKYMNELIYLFNSNKLPNKILLSGQKGQGKSTLAYHLINFVLSQNEGNTKKQQKRREDTFIDAQMPVNRVNHLWNVLICDLQVKQFRVSFKHFYKDLQE